jgi:hypothetical protein
MGAITAIDITSVRDAGHFRRLLRAILLDLTPSKGPEIRVAAPKDVYDQDQPGHYSPDLLVSDDGGVPAWRIVVVDDQNALAHVVDLARAIGVKEASGALKVLYARVRERREAKWGQTRDHDLLTQIVVDPPPGLAEGQDDDEDRDRDDDEE